MSLGFGVQHIEDTFVAFWRKILKLILRCLIGKNEIECGFWVATENLLKGRGKPSRTAQ